MSTFDDEQRPATEAPRDGEQTGSLDEPPDVIRAAPADRDAGDDGPLEAPEVSPGVPLWLHGVEGDPYTIYYLTALDLDATHEAGQGTRHAGIDGDRQVPGIGEPIARSGGSAYYYDAVGGKGFSRPVAPEEA